MFKRPRTKSVSPLVRPPCIVVLFVHLAWGGRAAAQDQPGTPGAPPGGRAPAHEPRDPSEPSPEQSTAEPSTSGPSNELSPPKLKRFVEAPYPQKAIDAQVQGRVVLELLIDETGCVTEAHVVQGLGYGLDEAARDATQNFTFTPAQKDGESRPARIKYAYEFKLPLADSPQPAPPAAAAPAVAAAAAAAAVPVPSIPRGSDDSDNHAPGSREHEQSAAPEVASHSATEVVVRGYRAEDQRLRSTAAVTVVDMEQASRESSDVGEVLARVEGVNVQRVGGLGSRARFSLAGFDDTQVRFFIDGIPLEYQGFSLGLQNVPLNLAERIEVYKGVVPVRLGADSLGGAFDLITNRSTLGTKTTASYQMGSFDTHRLTASARHLDEKTGFFVKGEGFFDTTRNDYPVVVRVDDDEGRLVDATRWRQHDAYRAGGGNLELGFVNRKWADRLLLKGYTTAHDKELQHNAWMTQPYGEAKYWGRSSGVNLRYENDFGRGLRGAFVTGYAYERTDFLDKPACVYDWYGQCLIEIAGRGEVRPSPSDQTIHDHTAYFRYNLDLAVGPKHKFVMSMAPTYFERKGEDHIRTDTSRLNALRAKREVFRWINGLEHQSEFFQDRLQNSLFVKNYLLAAQSVEVFNEYIETPISSQELHWGMGDGARFALNDWALLKASYEYAIRLPEPVELFGNSVQIIENLELKPERSHNFNLTFLINRLETRHGRFDASVTGFYRGAEELILLIGRVDVFRYENAYRANVYGVEGSASWLSPGDHVELGVNSTFQEYRNRSEEGEFSEFTGDRIPNKPYFFANAHARLRKKGALVAQDEISLSWYTRYTHEFFRAWESVGSSYDQPEVPSQLVHTAAATYLLTGKGKEELSFSVEAQNLTDEMVFDFYRVQKPGRAVYFKVALVH